MTRPLLDEPTLMQRILDHIDRRTTDLGDEIWREPVDNYTSAERLGAEIDRIFRRVPTPFCPSAALPGAGALVARDTALKPILVVRGTDGVVRAFRNACRHRSVQLAGGAGCRKAFSCRYHGWTYGLDGKLVGIPDEHGFPGLDKAQHGLVPVTAVEHGGMIFVTQDGVADQDTDVKSLPALFGRDLRLHTTT